MLSSSSASFLTSPFHISPSAAPPRYLPTVISPRKRRYTALLADIPATEREAELQKALAESEARDTSRKAAMASMQAASVLQSVYVGRVQENLQAQTGKPSRKKQWLLGDGLPKLLTADRFYSQVVEFNAMQDREQAEKKNRKTERARYEKEKEVWLRSEEGRKKQVAARRKEWKQEVEEWERGKAAAKAERQCFERKKPLLGKLERPLPKPRLAPAKEDGSDGDSSEEDDSEDDSEDEDESDRE
ncbi:hypothetical protein BV20DRAFT_939943 [Pilatotrama ljubarskyi]|nr:hypothetical protein BV20DRAFT_939943 [Pilatotrama ljubarskyi]